MALEIKQGLKITEMLYSDYLPMENQLNVMVLKCTSKAQGHGPGRSQNWSKPL